MSTQTLQNLLGWLIIASAIWASGLAITQTIKTVGILAALRGLTKKRHLKSIHDKYFREQDRISREVEPKFELWWSETGKRVVEASKVIPKNLELPFPIDVMPDEVQSMVMGAAARLASQNALSFAIQLASNPSHDVFIAEMRRVDASLADEHVIDRDKEFDQFRSELASFGINIDEFEHQFSA